MRDYLKQHIPQGISHAAHVQMSKVRIKLFTFKRKEEKKTHSVVLLNS